MLSRDKIEDLIDLQNKIFIAYSGGPDSTALIHIFADLMNSNKLDVEAIHVNHNLSKESKKMGKSLQSGLLSFRHQFNHKVSKGKLEWRRARV